MFQGRLEEKQKRKFHNNNEILYAWFRNCCTSNIYPDGSMLKKETMKIKKYLD